MYFSMISLRQKAYSLIVNMGECLIENKKKTNPARYNNIESNLATEQMSHN
jgi:hypothetical protein